MHPGALSIYFLGFLLLWVPLARTGGRLALALALVFGFGSGSSSCSSEGTSVLHCNRQGTQVWMLACTLVCARVCVCH